MGFATETRDEYLQRLWRYPSRPLQLHIHQLRPVHELLAKAAIADGAEAAEQAWIPRAGGDWRGRRQARARQVRPDAARDAAARGHDRGAPQVQEVRHLYCHDYSQYEPYIVSHRRLAKSLYCNVTGIILNRIPAEVEKHVQGKRYKRMKQHVKVKVQRSEDDQGGDGMPVNGEFDADAFEFANSQVIYSSEEEEQDGDETMEEKPKKNKRPAKGNLAPKKTRHKSKKVKKAD